MDADTSMDNTINSRGMSYQKANQFSMPMMWLFYESGVRQFQVDIS